MILTLEFNVIVGILKKNQSQGHSICFIKAETFLLVDNVGDICVSVNSRGLQILPRDISIMFKWRSPL